MNSLLVGDGAEVIVKSLLQRLWLVPAQALAEMVFVLAESWGMDIISWREADSGFRRNDQNEIFAGRLLCLCEKGTPFSRSS